MAVATDSILAHKHLRHLPPDLPGLSAAAPSRIYQDPHNSHRQAFNHNLTDQLFHKPPSSHTFTSHRRRKPHQPRPRHRRSLATITADAEDDRALAADPDVYLPGARHWSPNFQTKQQTPPLLEREDAFRAPPPPPQYLELAGRQWQRADFVADDADLYRLGLLYHDDEHARGSCFVRRPEPEPAYAYAMKRARRGGGRGKTTTITGSEDEERAPDLSRREDALAVLHEMAREGEEDAVVGGGVASRRGGRREEKEKEKSGVSPLEVIRELPEGSSPGPEAPADAEASSLWLSDAEEEDGHDWAFLDRAEAMEMEVEVEVEVEISCPADAEVDAGTDADDSGAMPATGDPWIMLGDDS
ncbi:hypothetical protein F4809DRAFT_616666 [Biscogniauxia mediterranea]|nr:hypothetical protein F4809DRAFT_616666 [Biscogniauxia mediterranea]